MMERRNTSLKPNCPDFWCFKHEIQLLVFKKFKFKKQNKTKQKTIKFRKYPILFKLGVFLRNKIEMKTNKISVYIFFFFFTFLQMNLSFGRRGWE